MSTLERTIAIAAEAQAGQADKTGEPDRDRAWLDRYRAALLNLLADDVTPPASR